MRAFLGSAALGAAAAVVLGLGATPAAADIKVGAVLSVTGPASFLGEPEEKTLKLYVDDINAKGGVNGQKLQLIVYDDGGDANKARTFATRLVEEDKVAVILGGSTTGTSMAMIPVFEEAQLPFISMGGGAVIVEPVKKFTFKTPHSDALACEKIFDDIKKRGMTKIGLIGGTDGFGKSMMASCQKLAPKYGLEIVGEETYNPADKDMTPQLTNLKNKPGIQALVGASFGSPAAVLTRNIKQLGLTLAYYQNHGVASKTFIELSGDAAEGVRLPAAAVLVAEQLPDSDPQKAVSVAYRKHYETATKQPISTFGGHAYDALMLAVEAMKRAGSADPKKVRDEIEKTKGFAGTGGIFNMSPTDHQGLDLASFKMLEIRNKDWKVVN
ncbi:MAG: ABC transporter substrate-binding protein [Hyphomicrobiaceae bacterium]|jgi:branched-chain amino acid transport system substrate-binding protein